MKIKKIAVVVLSLLMACMTGLIACDNEQPPGPGPNDGDGDNFSGHYTRFTESWRSVKQQGWAISKYASADAIERSLLLFDYLYSKEGNTLMSYGPPAYINGTISYNGKQVPKLSETALAELNDTKAGAGNYTNYYRRYLGATFPIGYIKEQGMEYQTVHPQGQPGLENILAAVRTGTMDHLQVSSGEYTPSSHTSTISKTNNVTLRMAVMYDSNSYITFNQANYQLNSSTHNYQKDSIKPVWAELATRLNFTIEDIAYKKSSATNLTTLWDYIQSNSQEYDICVADADKIVQFGVGDDGRFVNLADHLDKMPNFKHFLDSNPAIRSMILAGDEGMYYAPYFDGYDDIERMFMMRADWVKKLLDGETAPTFDTGVVVQNTYYTAFMPEELDREFKITKGSSASPTVGTVTKKYSKNIITTQNELSVKNGQTLTQALRKHIDDAYDGAYGTKRSDLFVGLNASYDADELVALMRCVQTNPALLTGDANKEMVAFYPRGNTADRVMDLFRLMSIWGVRGLDTRNLFMFADENGVLRDARIEMSTMNGIERLNQLYKEKLLLQDFYKATAADSDPNISYSGSDFRAKLNAQNRGFMTYDYNQTTTIVNNLSTGVKANGKEGEHKIEGFDLVPVLPPYTDWGLTEETDSTDLRFMTVPTANPLNDSQKTVVAKYTNLSDNFKINSSNGSNGADSSSAWHVAVMNGFGANKVVGGTTFNLSTKEAFLAQIRDTWNGKANNLIQNAAFQLYRGRLAEITG